MATKKRIRPGDRMNRPVYFLKSFEEAVGDLTSVAEANGHMTATIAGIHVAVPEDALLIAMVWTMIF